MKNIFVYIASPLKYFDLNTNISNDLKNINVNFFLPQTIGLPDALDHLRKIGDKCFDNIDKANVVIVVAPFGQSTASEIGYAINRKRKGDSLLILLFDPGQSEYKRLEAAISPYFDEVVSTQEELIKKIIKIQKKSED